MSKYQCRYASNGAQYTCVLQARSAAEAGEKMNCFAWVPGSSAIGTPKRAWGHARWPEALLLVMVAVVLGASIMLAAPPGEEPSQTAALFETVTP